MRHVYPQSSGLTHSQVATFRSSNFASGALQREHDAAMVDSSSPDMVDMNRPQSDDR